MIENLSKRRCASLQGFAWPIAAVVAALAASPAVALEYPIGKPQKQAGMEIAAVYLQPVRDGAGRHDARRPRTPTSTSKPTSTPRDKNANGFADGTWIPYLGIKYEITKQGGADGSRAR